MAKRGRKLVDYDGCRHNVEALGNAKKQDEIKLAKAKEQMEEARRLYEVLNKELHDELPALYDSRIPFLISSLQTLFSSEATFHNEYYKVHGQFSELIEALAAEAAKGSYQTGAHIKKSQNAVLNPDSPTVRSYEEIDFQEQANICNDSQQNGGKEGTDYLCNCKTKILK